MYSWLILGRPFATRGRRMHPAVGPGRDATRTDLTPVQSCRARPLHAEARPAHTHVTCALYTTACGCRPNTALEQRGLHTCMSRVRQTGRAGSQRAASARSQGGRGPRSCAGPDQCPCCTSAAQGGSCQGAADLPGGHIQGWHARCSETSVGCLRRVACRRHRCTGRARAGLDRAAQAAQTRAHCGTAWLRAGGRQRAGS